MIEVDLIRLELRLILRTGNIENSPASRHFMRFPLIALCSNIYLPGSSPRQRVVANAMAKSPQSLAPDCICTSTYWSWISDFWVVSSAAFCCFITAGGELYKLSYTNTLGCSVPMVLIVSQWPAPCSIWTNSFASMLKAKTLPSSLFWKPGRPNYSDRIVCAALTMSEFSHSVGQSHDCH